MILTENKIQNITKIVSILLFISSSLLIISLIYIHPLVGDDYIHQNIITGGINFKDPDELIIDKYKNLSGLGISSLFHYKYYMSQKKDFKWFDTGNVDFMKKKKIPSNINPVSINEFKNKLVFNKIQPIRRNVQKK